MQAAEPQLCACWRVQDRHPWPSRIDILALQLTAHPFSKMLALCLQLQACITPYLPLGIPGSSCLTFLHQCHFETLLLAMFPTLTFMGMHFSGI